MLRATLVPGAASVGGFGVLSGAGGGMPDAALDFGYESKLRTKLSVWGRHSKVKRSHSSEMAFWFAAQPWHARCYGGRLFSIDHRKRLSQELYYNYYRTWQGNKVGNIGWLGTLSYRTVRLFGGRWAREDQKYRYEIGPAFMFGKIYDSKYAGLGVSVLFEARPNRSFIFRAYGSIAGASRNEQKKTFGKGYGEHTSFSELAVDFSMMDWWKKSQFAYEITFGYRATFDLLRSNTILNGPSVGLRLQW